MMNQDETSLLRKIIFLSIAILAAVSSAARVKPAFAQIAPANFDAVDHYISTRMKGLGIPGAALVIVQVFQFDPQILRNWHGQIILLSSKDDMTTFTHLNELQTRYPTAQTHIFEQGGHHTVLLFPETYNAALIRFLEELP